MTPQQSVVLRRGDSGPAVAAVCERLILSGDLTGGSGPRRPRRRARLRRAGRAGGQVLPAASRAASSTASSDAPRMPSSTVRAGPSGTACCATSPSTSSRATTSWPCRPASPSSASPPARSTVSTDRAPTRPCGPSRPRSGWCPTARSGPETMRAFAGLRRSVSGGSANALREREHIRRSGYSLSGRTIVLDPGHGGNDSGAHGHRGLVEAHLALDLARRIEGRLSAHGVSVVFTHTDGDRRGHRRGACGLRELVRGRPRPLAAHGPHRVRLGPRGVDLLLRPSRQSRSRRLVRHRRELRRPAPARGRGPHRPDRLPRHTPAPGRCCVAPGCRQCASTSATSATRATPRALANAQILDHVAEAVVVALQRVYLGEADTSRTGVLRLDDLRRHLETMRAQQVSADSSVG